MSVKKHIIYHVAMTMGNYYTRILYNILETTLQERINVLQPDCQMNQVLHIVPQTNIQCTSANYSLKYNYKVKG